LILSNDVLAAVARKELWGARPNKKRHGGNRMRRITEMTSENIVPAASKPAEIRKLILKLRWIGMEEEAERLSRSLAEFATAECQVLGPRETD
jgi:hypothetical protein